MGSFNNLKTRKRKFGKVDTLLNEKLQKVKWGEFKIEEVLQWQSQKEIDPLKLEELKDETENLYPFYGQATINNGIISYNQLTKRVINNKFGKPTILIHSNNQNIVYLETPFYLKDGHGATSVLQCDELNSINQMFVIASIERIIKTKYSYNTKATKIELKNTIIKLPIKNDKIDFAFMESFILELEAERMQILDTYLLSTGLKDYTLTLEEENILNNYQSLKWKTYKLEELFGKATRGRRLKSADRISGNLPFVTAGETDEGVSAFIGNNVNIFSENTTTIDMFGSAKYRNYKYGGDDHIAIVHTESLPKLASIFVTTAIHKSSYNGQFNYGRNFYAKDADVLNITLPTKENKPDYEIMKTIISAIHKLVIKEVVLFNNEKIKN
ncbi:restriction endonuclease subunit S [Flavobacterium sp.]|uniref:restriction endonuclease subunit S n=1 Tax=Flavobacterium sp. TaxID=239 RepID=UPI00248A1793|nr:restriction endonuclease subunit S [Flavobacterium sp.]MDI1318455.1 restriction endonuclease subunit S [Flavobacterium sp.]